MSTAFDTARYIQGMEHLVDVVQRLSLATDLAMVVEIVRNAARALTGADGATFVLRDGEHCHYVDEDAIEPLWRNQRFPLDRCISGWVMNHARHVVIEDIYADARIPHDAYRPTFVKSLVMVPIRAESPIGAIGNYWASHHRASEQEIRLLQSLAHSTSVALTNVDLVASLRTSLEATRTARDELERQLRLRDDFLALASHELRTPLTPLYIQMHRLRETAENGDVEAHDPRVERIRRAVEIADRKLDDLGELAELMLDTSRISMGRLQLSVGAPVDLGEVARTALERMPVNAGTTVGLSAAEGVRGPWDATRLAQVVRILVDNAVKFGAGRPIDVEVSHDGSRARLLVRDRGIGIAQCDHASIFDRFERATDTTRYRGLGLGLYVARAIVEAHGGSISVASAPNEGAEFTVTLPLP